MMQLPSDIIRLIAYCACPGDLLSFCISSKKVKISLDEGFWKMRYFLDYPIHPIRDSNGKYILYQGSPAGDIAFDPGHENRIYVSLEDLRSSDRTWREHYILTTHYNLKYFPRKAIRKVAEKGLRLSVDYFLSTPMLRPASGESLRGAIEGNHTDLINYLIRERKIRVYIGKWDDGGSYYSAKAGNLELLKYFIVTDTVGVPVSDILNTAIDGAVRGNHRNIIDFIINGEAMEYITCKKPEENRVSYIPWWDSAAAEAIHSGNFDLVKLFISRGADGWIFLLDEARAARRDGRCSSKKIPVSEETYDEIIHHITNMAVRRDRMDRSDIERRLGLPLFNSDIDNMYVLSNFIRKGQIGQIRDHLKKMEQENIPIPLDELIKKAERGVYRKVLKFLQNRAELDSAQSPPA